MASPPHERQDAEQRMLGAVPGVPALGRGPAPEGDYSRHEYHHPAAGWGAARSVGRVLARAGEPLEGFRALFVMNHEDGGFDCPGHVPLPSAAAADSVLTIARAFGYERRDIAALFQVPAHLTSDPVRPASVTDVGPDAQPHSARSSPVFAVIQHGFAPGSSTSPWRASWPRAS
jgi:hypothetical protein